MDFETVLYTKKENIAIISLNRPDALNALNRQIIRDFVSALGEAETDPQVKVVIVKGEGRGFCAGDDLNEPIEPNFDTGFQVIETLHDVTRLIMRMPKPVIASLHGFAVGAGLEFAMNCDIRIAAEGTIFRFPETSIGVTVTNAGTKLLPMLVGMGRAKEMVFTGEKIDAAQANEWGLVNRVVPREDLEAVTLEMAGKILANNFLAIAMSKKSLTQAPAMGLEEVLNLETQNIMNALQALSTAFSS